MMQPTTSFSEASSHLVDSSSKAQVDSFKTAFIHLHSLASRDISLPCPQELLGVVQQLLIEVVVFYEQFAIPRVSPLTPEESDLLALYGQEFHLRLQFITNRIGERLMEAMLWAWLHSLLQGEKQWRQDLALDQSLEHSSLLLRDFAASTGLIGRIKCREKDATALRRVVVFTFEALRRISTLAPPVYTAEPEESSSSPLTYCACLAHREENTETAYSITNSKIEQEEQMQTTFTNHQLENRMLKAEQEIRKWKPVGPILRRQSSQTTTRSISRKEGISCSRRPVKENTLHLDLQTEFTEWLQSPPLNNLRIDHRLERRHWSLEQLDNPILTID